MRRFRVVYHGMCSTSQFLGIHTSRYRPVYMLYRSMAGSDTKLNTQATDDGIVFTPIVFVSYFFEHTHTVTSPQMSEF